MQRRAAQQTALPHTDCCCPALCQLYAVHVHQFGDLSSSLNSANISTLGSGVGSHFNPYGVSHGCDSPGSLSSKHVGDIGNYSAGSGVVALQSALIDLSFSNQSIIGRAVIVHASYDHCTQPTGDAGTPILQGVVGIGNPFLNAQFPPSLPAPASTTANLASLPLALSNDGNTSPNYVYSPLTPAMSACAVLFPYATSSADVQQPWGVVRFSPDPSGSGGVLVSATIRYLQPSSTHGFHIHQYGDDFDGSVSPYSPRPGSYNGSDHFANAASHFNPYAAQHGFPSNPARHEGDLGNLTADASGSINAQLTVSGLYLSLSAWNTSVLGRAVIVHLLPDNGSQPTGAAGDRILAGVIGLSNNSLLANVNSNFSFFAVPAAPASGDDKEEEYVGAAIVIVLVLLVLVLAAMYVRYSYAVYETACHVCDCAGCLRYYCGGKQPERERGLLPPEQAGGADAAGGYGALRD